MQGAAPVRKAVAAPPKQAVPKAAAVAAPPLQPEPVYDPVYGVPVQDLSTRVQRAKVVEGRTRPKAASGAKQQPQAQVHTAMNGGVIDVSKYDKPEAQWREDEVEAWAISKAFHASVRRSCFEEDRKKDDAEFVRFWESGARSFARRVKREVKSRAQRQAVYGQFQARFWTAHSDYVGRLTERRAALKEAQVAGGAGGSLAGLLKGCVAGA